MELYHGTTKENAEEIIKTQSFHVPIEDIDNARTMVPDLGYGVYTYGQDKTMSSCPKHNALMYAKKYKDKQSNRFSVLIVELNDDPNITFMDLDDEEERKTLQIIFRELRYRANAIYDNIKDSGAKRRHNLDGILIELAFKKNKLGKCDILAKETFTDFEGKEISNFVNGREVVIRNCNIISSINISK